MFKVLNFTSLSGNLQISAFFCSMKEYVNSPVFTENIKDEPETSSFIFSPRTNTKLQDNLCYPLLSYSFNYLSKNFVSFFSNVFTINFIEFVWILNKSKKAHICNLFIRINKRRSFWDAKSQG